MTGNHWALLAGCNYPNDARRRLHGCHRDVQLMYQTLIYRFRFNPNHVWHLNDDPNSRMKPTGKNIRLILNNMVNQARSGDVLFFHFSGHGMKLEPPAVPRTEEAIVPCDLNLITSVDFRHIVDRVPSGATFTILSDSCHSGGLIDKEPLQMVGPSQPPYTYQTIGQFYHPKMIPYESMLQQLSSMTRLHHPNIREHLLHQFGSDASLMFRLPPHQYPRPLRHDQGILLSGCGPYETCADGSEASGGIFSCAVEWIFSENPRALSNRQIANLARHKLQSWGYHSQHPCLYCSNENADAIFLTPGYHAR